MKKNDIKTIEKILIKILLLLAVIAIAGSILLIKLNGMKRDESNTLSEETKSSAEQENKTLDDAAVWLPDKCSLYQAIPDIVFYDQNNEIHSSDEFKGKLTILIFWASWCPDCQKQMLLMTEYKELAKQYGEINFIFLNKLDGEKETKEQAVSYFENLNIEGEMYFDEELSAYHTLGIKNIPTTLFLDENGIIVNWASGEMENKSQFEAYVMDLVYTKSALTQQFICNYLMDRQGGVHSTYSKTKEETEQSAVLSESQGLLMQYAVQGEKKELFDQLLDFVCKQMKKEEIISWKYENGENSQVNALLDDLRIYKSLLLAEEMWGGYDTYLESIENSIKKYGIKEEQYINFYDDKEKKDADSLTLCYIDLVTMKQLAGQGNGFSKAYENAKDILVNGQISEEFPLYYGSYSYKDKSYEKNELNAAEAMITLLHLAQAELLPEHTLDWLKTQIQKNGIKARYDVNGEVISGYSYDSTAVYGIIAMIGMIEKEDELTRKAIIKMESMRICNPEKEYNAAFGVEDGTQIFAFDQLIPLLTYQQIEQNGNKKQEAIPY